MQVRFTCPEDGCGAQVWEFLERSISTTTRVTSAGDEVVSTYDIMCSGADQHLVEVSSIGGRSTARLVDSPETPVVLIHDDLFADWDELDPNSDAFGVFGMAISEFKKLIEERKDGDDGGSTFTRMVFVQCFGAFEAFMADTLWTLVNNDSDARRRLVDGAEGLSSQTVRLVEVEHHPNIVLEKLHSYLRAVSYHDLTRVRRLFKTALDFDILPSDDKGTANDVLTKARARRHDCVHRNGRDVAGNLHVDITHRYVRQVMDAMLVIVNRIEDKIHPMPPPAARYFAGRSLDGDDDIPF